MAQARTNTQYIAAWQSHVIELQSVALDASNENFNEAQELLESIRLKADRLIHLGVAGCNFETKEEK